MTLRIVDGDWIELDGRPVAHLLPNLTLSLRDKLEAALDALDEAAEDIALLEDRIAQLEARLKAPAPEGRP
jgi:hypothetical protein